MDQAVMDVAREVEELIVDQEWNACRAALAGLSVAQSMAATRVTCAVLVARAAMAASQGVERVEVESSVLRRAALRVGTQGLVTLARQRAAREK